MNSAEARSNSAEAVTRLAPGPSALSRSRARSARRNSHVDALGALEQDERALLPVRPVRPGGQPLGGGVEQRLLVVDERPMLLGAQQRRGGAQVGARAAAEINDRDRRASRRSAWPARARACGCASDGPPARADRAIPPRSLSQYPSRATSLMTPAMLRAVSSQRGSFWPAAQEASAMRRRRPASCRTRWTASVRARSSPGGTLRAASSGTVSAAAPPVVHTIGSPRAMASASTMP